MYCVGHVKKNTDFLKIGTHITLHVGGKAIDRATQFIFLVNGEQNPDRSVNQQRLDRFTFIIYFL